MTFEQTRVIAMEIIPQRTNNPWEMFMDEAKKVSYATLFLKTTAFLMSADMIIILVPISKNSNF